MPFIFKEGTTHLVWNRGKQKLYKVNGLNISSSPEDSGMTRVQLLKNTNFDTNLPNHVEVLDIVTNKVEVPGVETIYWCHVVKLPNEYKKKHHIYQVR